MKKESISFKINLDQAFDKSDALHILSYKKRLFQELKLKVLLSHQSTFS